MINSTLGIALISIVVLLPILTLGIAFLQSGIDKVFHFRNNLEWLTGHFAKSFLNSTVPLLLVLLTFLELLAGILSLVSPLILFTGEYANFLWFYLSAIFVNSITLLALFSGQRIAGDYAGAASLIPYIILSVFSLLAPVFFSIIF